MLELFQSQLEMGLRIARIVADLSLSHVAISFVLFRARFAGQHQSKVMDQESGVAELAGGRENPWPHAFMQTMDKVQLRMASEQANILMLHVRRVVCRFFKAPVVRDRWPVPQSF